MQWIPCSLQTRGICPARGVHPQVQNSPNLLPSRCGIKSNASLPAWERQRPLDWLAMPVKCTNASYEALRRVRV